VSYEVGTKLKDKDVAKYAAVVEPMLVDGEEIKAFFWANALKPMKTALVVTNGRVIGISKADIATPAKALRDEVHAGDLTAAQVTGSRLGSTTVVLTTRDGKQREYATVQQDDAAALERHLAALLTTDNAVTANLTARAGEKSAARTEAPSTGLRARLHAKANEVLDENLAPDEKVLVVISGPSNQAIIGTNRRAFVYKKGFMAGATFGSELTSWDYRNLVRVQLHKGMMSGAVVLQAPGQSGTKTNYWKQGDDDPYKAPNAIPVVRPFDAANEGVAELRRLIAEAHAPVPVPASVPPKQRSVSDEIVKLVELRNSGLLTDDEFAVAKTRLLSQ
jgi:hypothetical protein